MRLAIIKLDVQPAAPMPRDYVALTVLQVLDTAADEKHAVGWLWRAVISRDALALHPLAFLGAAHAHCQRATPQVIHVVQHAGEHKEGLVLVSHCDLDRVGAIEQAAHQFAARVLPLHGSHRVIGETHR